jgi:hypothetical protein
MGEMAAYETDLANELAADFIEAIHSRKAVSGLTHSFYRYPARFSPLFAKAAIRTFTQPGELVLDPFMGGGTTLVEASASGRRAVGTDISELAAFVSTVKTTPLSESDLHLVRNWASNVVEKLNCHTPSVRADQWIREGYQRNISSVRTWPIRKTLEQVLARIEELPHHRQQRFARCALLKAGQWALDGRREIPPVQKFRVHFLSALNDMIEGMREFAEALRENTVSEFSNSSLHCLPLHGSAIDFSTNLLHKHGSLQANLVVTSPPYPGVYVLYHRWKVQGRKETPAPYWIADSRDGYGQAHYQFGDRRQQDLRQYFQGICDSFKALKPLLDPEALVVQMVAFSDPSWQTSRFLEAMNEAGYDEIMPESLGIEHEGRIWRDVPGRKWYAVIQGSLGTSKELVLFHRLRT